LSRLSKTVPRRKKIIPEFEQVIFLAKYLHLRKVEDVTVLQLNKENYVADYFIIGTIQTKEHSVYIAKGLKNIAKEVGIKLLSTEGIEISEWAAFNYGFCIIHLLTKNLREHYNLEDLWIDAKKIYWKNATLTLYPHPKKFV
jgi:ribosome-associated protein